MSGKSVPPSLSSISFSCPHCGAHAQQGWYDFYAAWRGGLPAQTLPTSAEQLINALKLHNERMGIPPAEDLPTAVVSIQNNAPNPPKDRARLVTNMLASSCHACKKFAIWVGNRIVHPAAKLGPDPNPDLPVDILQDYEEAQTIMSLSPRGSAALLRLAIQKLCVFLGEKGKSIDDDIAALVRKGLNVRVQQALDIVRVIGNEAVHPGELDLRDDQETATKLLGLVNLIAEKMISEPRHVDALFGSLPEAKRSAIEKRDKKS